METLRKALIVGALLGAGAGVGSALFVLVAPGEQRKQAMLKVGATGSPRWGGRAESPRAGGQDCEPPFPPAGDARARPAAQGGGGQDQRVSASHSAGGSGHARERGLEEELDGRRRREVSVSWDFHRGHWDLAPAQESEAAFLLRTPSGETRSRMPRPGLPEALGAAAG